MALLIPLQAVPSQALTTVLDGQQVNLRVYQRRYGLFIDVYLNDTLIIGGVIGLDRCLVVRSLYLGFPGDFIFVDTQGLENPDYTGLGDRWLLLYLTPSEA